jgi:TPP-dependent pyruvate/acetoin dehydrogenase alpha subunit
MHETFNMAQKWKLPVIFYCENNRYSEMTPISAHLVGQRDLYVRARLRHGEHADRRQRCRGRLQAVSNAAARARAGEGPTFIEGITYRLSGHMAGDLETYRTTEEIDMQRAYEPLTVLHQRLLARGVEEEQLAHSRRGGARSGRRRRIRAEQPLARCAEAYTDVYVYAP